MRMPRITVNTAVVAPIPNATTSSAAHAKDGLRLRIRRPKRRSRHIVRPLMPFPCRAEAPEIQSSGTLPGRTCPQMGRTRPSAGLARYEGPGLLPETAVLETDQALGAVFLESTSADVIHEPRRDAVVAKADDLIDRQVLDPNVFHVRDVVGRDAVIVQPHKIVNRQVFESLSRDLADEGG